MSVVLLSAGAHWMKVAPSRPAKRKESLPIACVVGSEVERQKEFRVR